MSAERVPGEAGVIRVLGQNGGSASPDFLYWTDRPRPARGDRDQSEAVWGSLVTLLAAALQDPREAADALLDRFGCLAAVLAASEADLLAIPGVTVAAARLLGAAQLPITSRSPSGSSAT